MDPLVDLERRRLRLGKLTVRGDRVVFEAGRPDFEAPHGEEVEIGLDYDFEETSELRERGRVALTVEVGGMRRTTQVEFEDRPLVQDRAVGFVSHMTLFPKPGEVSGVFELLAETKGEPWIGKGKASKGSLHEAGRFVVHVR